MFSITSFIYKCKSYLTFKCFYLFFNVKCVFFFCLEIKKKFFVVYFINGTYFPSFIPSNYVLCKCNFSKSVLVTMQKFKLKADNFYLNNFCIKERVRISFLYNFLTVCVNLKRFETSKNMLYSTINLKF